MSYLYLSYKRKNRNILPEVKVLSGHDACKDDIQRRTTVRDLTLRAWIPNLVHKNPYVSVEVTDIIQGHEKTYGEDAVNCQKINVITLLS